LASVNSAIEILKKYWGYDSFRSKQEAVINSILLGNDTLALLATGAGKSICFQVPAMVLEGKTVVISPLIALMQDQVQALRSKGIDARAIYAGMRAREIDIILDNFVHGPTKILYVSPERADTEIFIERFKRADISLIAVDEAHCISQWGYDFRPAYFTIKTLREWKPQVPMIAVTATATEQVVKDITLKLALDSATVISSSFARKNISFSVMITENKNRYLLDILQKLSGVGIIYMRSRAKVKELAEWLEQRKIKASYYHGGLPMKTRLRIQEDWQNSTSGLIICTNAFGMGVDKPDVRFVIHLDVPPSIEEYYQEAGRAGRDGKQSHAISIIGHSDIMKLDYNTLISFPPIEEISLIYQKLCAFLKVAYGSGVMESYHFDFELFCDRVGFSKNKVFNILNILEKEGWLSFNQSYKNPSTILFTSSKSKISLSSRNRDLKSKILVELVRRYEGLFINHTSIDERKLADRLQKSEEVIRRQLEIMDRESILQYKPTKEGPQVTFLIERVPIENFTIDSTAYNFRSERAKERKLSITDYMLTDDCRQMMLLKYFNEKSEPCGTCDICLGSADVSFSSEEKDKVKLHISKYLKKGPLDLDYYLLIWPFNKRRKAKACIIALENEEYLSISDTNIIILLPKKSTSS